MNLIHENESDCQEFLNLQRLGENIYTTGLYHSGITIYRQQIRALNLFYALVKCGKIGKNKGSVCVVGGGIAGLTFSAAAIKAGIQVDLLEKQPKFLSLQTGCDIRNIHPNIYDWPKQGSTNPYARLPVMSWVSGPASKVAQQLWDSFKTLNTSNKAKLHRNAVIDDISQTSNGFKVYGNFRNTDATSYPVPLKNINPTCIIFCTGFGIESGSGAQGNNTPSYWWNENFAQELFKREEFTISGNGDGALIDLLRLKIRGFSYEKFLKRLEDKNEYKDKLLEALLKIRKDWVGKKDNSHLVYDAFNDINDDWLQVHRDYFKEKDRNNIHVELVSRQAPSEIFDLNHISLLNAFLYFIFITSDINNFKFVHGEVKEKDTEKGTKYFVHDFKNKTEKPPFGKLLIRHGTERQLMYEEILKTVTGEKSPKLISHEKLENKQKYALLKPDLQLWDEVELAAMLGENDAIGFCSNETVSICTSLLAALYPLLSTGLKKSDTFRVVLHRQNNASSMYGYQQMAQYYGISKAKGNMGRIFPLERGNVGLTFATAKPIFLVKENDHNDVVDLLDLSGSKALLQQNVFLSIPITTVLPNGIKVVNVVVYIDASPRDFFEKNNRIKLIMAVIKGWANFIDESIEDKNFMMGETVGPIFVPSEKSTLNDKLNTMFDRLTVMQSYKDSGEILEYITRHPIEFKRFYSFDIFHNLFR